ncbi:MAG TPA: ABC transporter ATP-binding protein [Thermotogota bacterium]|nr:ABC transporter ATP-binding protein [Thermotogota bacterium]HRW35702.1 ABC transporter ATP-binding protein [Thermotogota bacterium]
MNKRTQNNGLWTYMLLKWYWLIPTIIVITGYSALKIAEGHMLASLINSIVEQDKNQLARAIYLTATVFSGSVCSFFLWKFLAIQFSDRLCALLQRKISNRIAKATDHTMHQNHSGDIISRMSNDLMLFQEMLQKDIFQLFGGIATAIFAMIYLFSNNWLLTVVVLASLPVIGILSVVLSSPIEKYTQDAQKSLSDINKEAKESITGAEIIRAFNMQPFFLNRFKSFQNTWTTHSKKKVKQSVLLLVFGILVAFIPFLIVFGFGGYLVLQGQITVGLLFAFIQLLNYIAFPLQELPLLLGKIKSSIAGGRRLISLLSVEVERSDGIEGTLAGEDLIRFENVSFRYPDQKEWALKDVSFSIRKGERIAFVGSSGCGKSTVFKLILGDYSPQKGKVIAGDHKLEEWSLHSLRNHMATVVQEPFLLDISIQDNITLGHFDAQDPLFERVLSQAQINTFLSQLPDGLETLGGELGSRFSGGQRQRICVARALMKQTPLILMDEATSALDNETESLILKTIRELPGETTILMIAHRIQPLGFVDRFIVMDQGRIVEEGNHEELIEKNGRYKQLFQSQLLAVE